MFVIRENDLNKIIFFFSETKQGKVFQIPNRASFLLLSTFSHQPNGPNFRKPENQYFLSYSYVASRF